MLKFLGAVGLVCLVAVIAGCSNDAQVASSNLSQAADNFQVNRRIVFYNGVTNDYMLEIDGYCSLGSGTSAKSITVTCKTQDGFKKHILGLSDNVTYFVQQIDAATVGVQSYRVTFKPSVIVPDVQLR